MKNILSGIVLSVVTLLSVTALSLFYLHVNDTIYVSDLHKYDLTAQTGMTEEDILANYHAVMDYLSPFSDQEFTLPSLAFSENGAYHFYETKLIFQNIYRCGGVCAILLAAIIFLLRTKKESERILLISGLTTIMLPSVVLLGVAISFDKAFILFHEVFFNNNMWIFDPKLDPIINILPESFFMHCAVVIAVSWIAAAIIQLAAYLFLRKKRSAAFVLSRE